MRMMPGIQRATDGVSDTTKMNHSAPRPKVIAPAISIGRYPTRSATRPPMGASTPAPNGTGETSKPAFNKS